MEQDVTQPERVRNRPTILGVMSAGHGVAHLYDQGFPVLMPTIASYFGLSSLQVSVLLALRFTGFGVVNIGGGLVVDMLKRRWGEMLTGCMVSASLFFALVGSAPNYLVLLLIVPVVNIPGALWHLPSAASLSQIFPERRGFALAIHGFGANLGNQSYRAADCGVPSRAAGVVARGHVHLRRARAGDGCSRLDVPAERGQDRGCGEARTADAVAGVGPRWYAIRRCCCWWARRC